MPLEPMRCRYPRTMTSRLVHLVLRGEEPRKSFQNQTTIPVQRAVRDTKTAVVTIDRGVINYARPLTVVVTTDHGETKIEYRYDSIPELIKNGWEVQRGHTKRA